MRTFTGDCPLDVVQTASFGGAAEQDFTWPSTSVWGMAYPSDIAQGLVDTGVFRFVVDGRVVATIMVRVHSFTTGGTERCDRFGRDI